MAEFQERQTAIKKRVSDLTEGEYKVEEGWNPNYLLTADGEKISRVNLMGIILSKEQTGTVTSFLFDDGSGTIKLRLFEELKTEIEPGEPVLVIGKIRVFNEEKYVAPEIIKKTDKKWLEMRRKEIGQQPTKVKKEKNPVEVKEEVPEKILELIKELDHGEGALIEDLKEKVGGVDELIDKMLKDGEIFQNMPGRVKVL